MNIGYYDWNESIAYPLTEVVDTNVAGVSLSGLIVGASISLPADIVDAIGGDLYVAAVMRDRFNSVLITVAGVPTLPATPVFAIDFRVNQGTERFVVVPGVVRGSLAGARAAAFLVIANNAFIPALGVGQVVTFTASTLLDPAVLRVSDRGDITKFSVIKSVKSTDLAIPYVDNAAQPLTQLVLDRLSGAPIDTIALSPSGAQYQLVVSGGTTYVSMPTATTLQASVQTGKYDATIQPTIYIGRTVNLNTGAVVGVPVSFRFDDWISNPAIYSVITAAIVYVNGVQTAVGGPNGVVKASLAAGFKYTFTTPGTYLISIAAMRTQLVGVASAVVSFITFSATIVVTTQAAYYALQGVSVPVASPAMASVGVPAYTLTPTPMLVETHSISRPLLPAQTIGVALGGDYDAEDLTARAAVPAETLIPVAVLAAPVITAGKNLGFAFSTARNAVGIAVAPGAHTTVPYVGYAVPAFVSCSGAVRTLFGANADKDGGVIITAGAGVTVIPEPSAHRITIVIEDPRASQSGAKCSS